MIRWCCWWAAVLLVTAACSSIPTPTLAPTQPLITSIPSTTPVPPTESPTPSTALAPADLFSTDAPSATQLPEAALISQVISSLAAEEGLDVSQIELVSLQSTQWTTPDLDCSGRTGDLKIDGFRVVLTDGTNLYEYHTDSAGARFVRCTPGTPPPNLTPDALLSVDPVAAELVALARQSLADELGLPLRRIRLIDLQVVRWTDGSLGCPTRGQTYMPQTIRGYRMVFEAGDQQYLFHSDNERVIPCEFSRAVLPGGTPTATLTPTSTETPTVTASATATVTPSVTLTPTSDRRLNLTSTP